MQLPKDPPTLPKQDGTGGTFNFQLHPAFWVGMALCDDQLAPNPGGSSISPNIACTPDSEELENYDRIGFETDLPRIESTCNRATGANCVNPPAGASFYPFYTTQGGNGSCTWQLGGANNPGTKQTFGGSSNAEYGPPLFPVYSAFGGAITRINNFRNVLSSNPCPSKGNIASLD